MADRKKKVLYIMHNGVILKKLQSLDQALVELHSLGQVDASELNEDWRTRRAVERNLQILVEIVMDICQRVISISGETPAATGAEAIERCVQIGAMTRQDAYRKMAQFRNFIVHRYEKVDVGILAEMVNKHLVDFERFRSENLNYVQS